ncbi:MAG: hypothetical protein DSZ03_07750 [Sulfurimonas sp.]|nr:MAG: hypothetical protein DSZ03_07750 [Sulfurimonas sp.]
MTLLANSALLYAYNYKDRGAYGKIEFRYIDDFYETNTTRNSQKDFIQEYLLGYMGNVYSPRLLDYTVEGVLRFENIDTETESVDYTTKIDSQDYKVNLAFIKETKYPVTVYAQRTNRPFSTIYSQSINRYTQDIQKYGIMGSMKFDMFMLSYGASKNKGVYEGIATLQDRDTTTYRISARRNKENYNLQVSYLHLKRITDQTYASREATTIDQTDDRVDVKYGWDISKTLTFNSGLSYLKSDYYRTESTTADASLRWMPNQKYNGMISMSASRSDQLTNISDVGDTQVYGNQVDMLNINQVFNYNVTPEFMLTESMSYYNYSADAASGTNYNLRLGANYRKKLYTDTRLQLTSSIDMRSTENSTKTTIYSDYQSLDKTSYIVNLGARVNQNLPTIRSTLNAGMMYYAMRTSLDETRDRYSINSSLYTKLFGEFTNRIEGSYMNDKSLTFLNTNNDLYSRVITRLDLGEYVDYTTRLGVRGRLSLKVGVRYSKIDNDGLIVSRTVPRADMNLNYRFWQRLIFSAGAHVDKDLTYNYMNYSANANINYRIRKISFSMGYQYYRTKVTDVMDNLEGTDVLVIVPERDRSRFEMKLSRRF